MSLGSLIPPSIILVVYGITAEQSIGRLLIAGIIPGILHMTLYIITVQLLAWFNPSIAPAVPKANWGERISAFGGGLVEVVLVFMITMGGLLLGWFTPTEAGAVGAFCLFIITLLRKKMNWEKTISSLRSSTNLTAQIFFLVASAKVFGRFIAVSRIPFEFASFIQSVDIPPFLVVLAIMFISMLLGCIIDAMPLILLIIPVFLPVIENLGYDPVWFGIQIVVVCSMGILTPPVGIGIYIIKGIIPDVPIQNIFKNIWPFLLTDWAFAIILVIFPSIATFLPGLLF